MTNQTSFPSSTGVKSTMRLHVADSGVIYRNPLPGHQALSVMHPFALPLSETEVLCTAKHGQAQYSADNMVHLHRSGDGGRTWKHEGPLRDRRKDPRPYQYSAGGLTRLRDGALVMNNWRCDRSDPNKLYVHPKTGGSLPLEGAFFRSTDGGRTWSEPLIGAFPPAAEGMIHALGGPVIELRDGTWMQLSEPWIAYGSTQPYDVRTYAMFSRDGGRTWGESRDIANGMPQGRGYSHAHAIHLPDGRLFAAYWTMNAAMTEFFDLHVNESTDATGRQWTQPRPTGLPGQSSYPVLIDERRLAIIYSERGGKRPGTKVALSEDLGQTWDVDGAVTVWDAYGKEALGVPMTDTYPSSHDAIAYGAPHVARLSPRELLATFWCTQSADTHVRYTRVVLEEQDL